MPQLTLQQAIQLAMQHHQSGQLLQAESIYRQILTAQPDHPDALNLLGVVTQQLGRNDEAIPLIRRSISLRPAAGPYHLNLGVALEHVGQLAEAAQSHRQAIRLAPDLLSAYSNLASVLIKQRKLDEAIATCRQAIAKNPAFAPAHQTLGNALDQAGRHNEAAAAFSTALRHNPKSPEAHNGLATVLGRQSKLTEALAECQRALQLAPNYAPAHNTLGNILREQGRLNESASAHREAIRLRPTYAEAHYNLGVALQRLQDFDQARAAYQQAIALNPALVDAHVGLAGVLHCQGNPSATASYQRALSLDPDNPDAHWGMALEHLLSGRFTEGWREYDWRWRCQAFAKDQRHFDAPLWDGTDPAGRTILLHMEQGYGDAIQFVRYAPLLHERGATVLLQVEPPLTRLLSTTPGISKVLSPNDPLPPFDVHCPLLSLPARFATTLDTIPDTIPYLTPPPAAIEQWRQHLPSTMKIGLTWAGNPSHTNDRRRSCSLRDLAPLAAALPTATFVSLQKGPAAIQSRDASSPFRLLDLTDSLNDFADTAALIANLDMVISVDTAVAHLSGALAKPTCLLLPQVPDWRWLRDRADSPWYPTMTLFRQEKPDDWTFPIQQLAANLREFPSGEPSCA